MKDRAYAKINMCLEVVGKRDDGYHELEMIMVPINFYDLVDIEINDQETTVKCNAWYLPVNEKNTVVKAINVLRNEYGFKEHFTVKLTKHIPTQAGLAGGSADAAAAIRIIKRLLKLPMNQSKMIELAKKVGADVPFCCLNRPAYVAGIGDEIKPFSLKKEYKLLLVKPKKGVSTKKAFEYLAQTEYQHYDCSNVQDALVNDDYHKLCQNLNNTLEDVAIKLVPEIKQIKEQLVDMGFAGVLMSGSGSTIFALSENDELLKKASDQLKSEGNFVRITKIMDKKKQK